MFSAEPELAEVPLFLKAINLTAVVFFTVSLAPAISNILSFQQSELVWHPWKVITWHLFDADLLTMTLHLLLINSIGNCLVHWSPT